MGSPRFHELELLPLKPSSTSKAQPLCISGRSSLATRTSMEAFNSQSVAHASGGYRIPSKCGKACIDVNQIPSGLENQDEFAEFPFTLQLSYDTKPSPNGLKLNVASSSRTLVPTSYPEPTNAFNFEHERTPNDVSARGSDDEESGSITRKKLRLSKEESSLLEESFKENSTLNPKQKSTLAKQLNLRPRQVEVWFQNRRARTKLKQIEADSEMLKRCCEALTEENRKLQREVEELRALQVGGACVMPHDFCMSKPATTMTMCPSCECLSACPTAGTTSTTTSISSFSQPSNLPLTFSPQQQPSPACN